MTSGRRLLDEAERVDQRHRHALAADAEILQRTLRLGAPVALGRDLDRAEGVGLGAGVLDARLAGSLARATSWPLQNAAAGLT